MASTEEHGTLPLPQLNPAPKVLLVAAPFYRSIADGLITGARTVVEQTGGSCDVIEVPGALEIPTAIHLAQRHYEGFVALGCVIRGETTHYETVCNDSSRALTLLGLEGICIGNGILTCETMDQAKVRADPNEMDKGGGAAAAALHLIALRRCFHIPDRPDRAPTDDGDDILMANAAGLTRTA
ncbi:MAG: 6,7-dimethyl-8-ribityllumazine synthase [Pseudomonadota bacterium]